MSWANVTYALWALIVVLALTLWMASSRAWKVGRAQVGRPSDLLAAAFRGRSWLRALVVVGWVWFGFHLLAR